MPRKSTSSPSPSPSAPPPAWPLVQLPVAQLAPSAHNPRTTSGTDDKSVQELAASLRAVGVVQPVLVRRWPATEPRPAEGVVYQLIAGERRWRAAVLAELPDLPGRVVDPCTDCQAAELRTVENLQRVGLTKLEEAEGYQHLLDLRDSADKPVHTAESIAARIGKSPSYVRAVLQMLRLPEPVKLLVLSGRLCDNTALLVVRIPDPAQQLRAATLINRGPLDEPCEHSPHSFRDAQRLIHERFMRTLDGAPFDAEDCAACEFRTGNQAGLYADVRSRNTCTRVACWQEKARRTAARQRAVEQEECGTPQCGMQNAECGMGTAPTGAPTPPASAPIPPSALRIPHSLDLSLAANTAALCIDDAWQGRSSTAWVRWLCLHGPGAVDDATFTHYGVNGSAPERARFLADRTLPELVALLVRSRLHPNALHHARQHWTPAFLAACATAGRTPPNAAGGT